MAGLTAVTALYGSIHGITLAFGITLLGITIDYPIHLFSHMKREEGSGRVLQRIWPTLRLGALTTCLGFSAMMAAGFSGLTQLALFAVAGLLAAALASRLVLLPLMDLLGWQGRSHDDPTFLHSLLSPPLWIRYGALCTGFACFAYLAVNSVPWEDDLAALSPVPEDLITLDRTLRSELVAPEISHMLVVRGTSVEDTLQRCEVLEKLLGELVAEKVLQGYRLPSHTLPSVRTQKLRQEGLPDRKTLAAELERAGRGLPFKPNIFDSFIDDVVHSGALAPLTLAGLENTALSMQMRTQLFPSGDGWLAIVPLSGVKDSARLETRVNSTAGASAYTVNLRKDSSRMINRFRNSALHHLAVGVGLIGLVLLAGLRSPLRVAQVMGPVVLALIVGVTLLVATGHRLSLFHLVSLLLVAGITIDYSLFFSRRGDSDRFRVSTLHALTTCLLSTLAVFGLLALSRVPVLSAIGLTVVFGVLAGFLMSLALAQPPVGRS